MNKRAYPWALVSLLSFNFGVVYFDRNALNFLMPLVQPELHLVESARWACWPRRWLLSWALAGLLVGRLSDLLQRRKIILVVAAVIFSVASVLAGWVNVLRHAVRDAPADGIGRRRRHAHYSGPGRERSRARASRPGHGCRPMLRIQSAGQFFGAAGGDQLCAGIRLAQGILPRRAAGFGGGVFAAMAGQGACREQPRFRGRPNRALSRRPCASATCWCA
jgi:MFS family permease